MGGRIALDEPLLGADQIQSRIVELAEQINTDYRGTGRPLSVIVVLKGACFFAIDLLKHIDLHTRLDFLQASSYAGTGSTGEVTLHKDITMSIAGTDVLL